MRTHCFFFLFFSFLQIYVSLPLPPDSFSWMPLLVSASLDCSADWPNSVHGFSLSLSLSLPTSFSPYVARAQDFTSSQTIRNTVVYWPCSFVFRSSDWLALTNCLPDKPWSTHPPVVAWMPTSWIPHLEVTSLIIILTTCPYIYGNSEYRT